MTRFVDDTPDTEPQYETHPSYGMISVNRRQSSGTRLFGVDYPQGHLVAITIKGGRIKREGGSEWFYGDNEIIEIEMSEVQYARMISAPNTGGVACTLRHGFTDGFKRFENPPEHMVDEQAIRDDIKSLANKASGNFDHVAEMLRGFIKDKPPSKAQLREMLGWIEQGQQGLNSDLPYAVQQADEKVTKVVNAAKTEIDAHLQYTLAEMGRESVRERIASGESIPLRLGFGGNSEEAGE